MKSGKPEIYFHIGMMRTATTYLQKDVFPYLSDIHYVKKNHFKKADKIIAKCSSDRFLLSYEFHNHEFYTNLERFALKYPEARIIIVLRRHSNWIISHYKRHVKNGYSKSFQEYFDVENDEGWWKKDDLVFFKRLKWIENRFEHPPLVLFQEDLKADPTGFLNQIFEYTHTKPAQKLSFQPRHVSYSDNCLIFKQRLSQKKFLKELETTNKSFKKMRIMHNKFIRYTLLGMARLLPESYLPNTPLVPQCIKNDINNYYLSDWNRCKEYADKTNQQVLRVK